MATAEDENIETAILHHLAKRGTITMEDAIHLFNHLTFNQVFSAVDRLSREGKIRLVIQAPYQYAISPMNGAHADRREGAPRN